MYPSKQLWAALDLTRSNSVRILGLWPIQTAGFILSRTYAHGLILSRTLHAADDGCILFSPCSRSTSAVPLLLSLVPLICVPHASLMSPLSSPCHVSRTSHMSSTCHSRMPLSCLYRVPVFSHVPFSTCAVLRNFATASPPPPFVEPLR